MKRFLMTLVVMVMLLGLAAPSFAGRQDVTLINDSGYRIDYVYCSSIHSNSWGDDWLASNQVIYSGQSFFMRFPDWENDCRWDFMVVDEDGDQWEARDVNLCSIYRVILYFRNGRIQYRFE